MIMKNSTINPHSVRREMIVFPADSLGRLAGTEMDFLRLNRAHLCSSASESPLDYA